LPTDEKEIAADMYVALLDFFDTFKELQDRPFVITGESYAGKYIPSIGGFFPPRSGSRQRGRAVI
jgi:vitellogenic carboxypeptidase-like protein